MSFTLIRMTLLKDAAIYLANPMMNANLAYLGYILMVFALFNSVFVNGFFKTAYYTGRPILLYSALSFFLVLISEIIHHIPSLEGINSQSEDIAWQAAILGVGIIICILSSAVSLRSSERKFELLDL